MINFIYILSFIVPFIVSGQEHKTNPSDTILQKAVVYDLSTFRNPGCIAYGATFESTNSDHLDSLVAFFNAHKNEIFEIANHTDTRGSADANQDLSQGLADQLKEALIKRGIDEKRIIAKGYGESQPKTVWLKHDDGRLDEVILTETYINQFRNDKKKFEMLHQINQRLELIVIGTLEE